MIESAPIWVITDIDGTLMDHSYDLTPAKETIEWLTNLNIPVIPCTSKTAAEVRVIRQDLGLNDPFIVENGAAIHGGGISNDWEIILGKSYIRLHEILNHLSKDVDYKLVPLNDLNDQEAYQLTRLNGNDLDLMRDRHWSMPFLNPPNFIEDKLLKCCSKYDVNIFRGNRMSHLLSINSDKGKAVKRLIEFSKNYNVKTIGLGDSPNDLPLLQTTNFKIVIPGLAGPNLKLINQLSNVEYILAKDPHGYGWKSEITKLIQNLLDEN